MLSFSLKGLLLLALAVHAVTVEVGASEPEGSTGCTGASRCWRYCSGAEGPWCYTGDGCKEGKLSCYRQTGCLGSCAGGSAGCVTSCPARDESKPAPPVPRGSTGCSGKFKSENGLCWRYCRGSSGSWCYTKPDCNSDNESCAKYSVCSRNSCEGAVEEGCVAQCGEDETAVAVPEPEGATGCTGASRCWRYCTGGEGPWCYTGDGCKEGKTVCHAQTGCNIGSCAGGSAGCVTTCPAPDESRPPPPVPRGSTGCSTQFKAENGLCWRYCRGTSGPWCYTKPDCNSNNESCAKHASCARNSCEGGSEGCVTECEPDDAAEEEEYYYVTYTFDPNAPMPQK